MFGTLLVISIVILPNFDKIILIKLCLFTSNTKNYVSLNAESLTQKRVLH